MKRDSVAYMRNRARRRRIAAIRKKIKGTPDRPRLAVYRSLTNIYAQIIDDTKGVTLLSLSTLSKDLKLDKNMKKTEQSYKVGYELGKLALEKGITAVRFDRGGFLYHGRVKALAEGARKAGLKF